MVQEFVQKLANNRDLSQMNAIFDEVK